MNFEKYLPKKRLRPKAILIRMPSDEISERLAKIAKKNGVSVNAICVAILTAALEEAREPKAEEVQR